MKLTSLLTYIFIIISLSAAPTVYSQNDDHIQGAVAYQCFRNYALRTKFWKTKQEAVNEFGKLVTQDSPSFTDWYTFQDLNGVEFCEAHNNSYAGYSPPDDGMSGVLNTASVCQYNTSAGTVVLGSYSSSTPDGVAWCYSPAGPQCPSGHKWAELLNDCVLDKMVDINQNQGGGQCSSSNTSPLSHQGNPINILIGSKYHEEKIQILNRLTFSLSYNSAENNSSWNTSLSERIEFFNNDGSKYQSVDELNWYPPELGVSKERNILPPSAIAYINEEGNYVRFIKNDTSWYSLSSDYQLDQAESTYMVTTRRYKITFDEEGRILEKTNFTDMSSLSFSYNVAGNEVTISNQNNQYKVGLNEKKLPEIIYAPEGNILLNWNSDDQLISLNHFGHIKMYHYENIAFPYALTGITNERGVRYATWIYDSEGRAISSEHANAVDQVNINYTFIDDAINPRITVTNPLSKQTTYHYTTIHGVRKVTQVEGHPSVNCSGANQAYTYDANGFMASKTDWQGNITTYVHNDRGQEISRTEASVSRTEASGTPEARTITTEWHSEFNLPVKITEPKRETIMSYDANGRLLLRESKHLK